MKISCPHCSQNLQLDPETLAALQGQPHFACPTCQGIIGVPETKATKAGPVARPKSPLAAPRRSAASTKHQVKSRMLLFATLMALCGSAAFFFSPSGARANHQVVDVLALSGVTTEDQSGNWTLTQQGLEVKATNRATHLETPYEPKTNEYELNAEFSLTAPRTGYITFRFPTRRGYVPLFLQARPGPKFMGHHMGGYDGLFMRGGAAADLLKLGLAKESQMQFVPGRTYALKVEIGESSLKVTLDGESLISWKGDLSRWRPNPSLPSFTPSKLVIGADRGGIIFHRITSLEKTPSAPSASKTAQLLKTESLGGVRFRLPEADLKKLLGEPDKWGEEGKDVHNGGTLIEANYRSKGMVIQLRTDEKSGLRMVDEVFVEPPSTQRTSSGIQVGSTLDDLRRVYGDYEYKDASTKSLFVVGTEREGIYFGLEEGRVIFIRLGAGYE